MKGRWRIKWANIRCHLWGHDVIVVGKCSQVKPHFCPKGRLTCARCGRIHTDKGWQTWANVSTQ